MDATVRQPLFIPEQTASGYPGDIFTRHIRTLGLLRCIVSTSIVEVKDTVEGEKYVFRTCVTVFAMGKRVENLGILSSLGYIDTQSLKSKLE